MDDEILAHVEASTGRRVLGLLSLWILAFLLFYVAMAQPPALGWQIFLIALGGATLLLAERLRRATSHRLELTQTELRDSAGQVLAQVDQIERVEAGMFAFKPSNGFLLKLSRPAPVRWMPGLWWRYGRRVGVGGMTPARQSKAMAEILSAMVASRVAGVD